jgi:hypothetical protein
MSRGKIKKTIGLAFERELLRINLDKIAPLYVVGKATKATVKFKQTLASILEIGLVEPMVVVRDQREVDKYTLLDGHLRLEVLKDQGVKYTLCILSIDDEAFTYNKRISRLATIQEHKMILKALTLGVPEERLAKALNINVKTLQEKKRLLEGICPEAVELLKDKQVTMTGFRILKKMKPIRQMEAAQLMVAMNKYTVNYARSLLAATPEHMLTDPAKPKQIRGISQAQLNLMERESASLERELRLVEDTYGIDHLVLILTRGYVSKLMNNARIVRYLEMHHNEYIPEFEKIAESGTFVSETH